MTIKTTTINKTNLGIFEEARETAVKLTTLTQFLTAAEVETLEILLDKKSVNLLTESLNEAKAGKLESIKKIL